MVNNLNLILRTAFPFLIFSPGLRGLGIIYYPFLFVSLFFNLPLIIYSAKSIYKSRVSIILIAFFLITAIGLLSCLSEFTFPSAITSFMRLGLISTFVLYIYDSSLRYSFLFMVKYYLLVCFIASFFIYIQYITGPLPFFSEAVSTRSGLFRYSTISGSTNMYSVSVAFSILISTYTYKNFRFLYSPSRLLVYQLFILGGALLNLSRSGLFFSIIAFLISRVYLIFTNLNKGLESKPFILPLRLKLFNPKISKLYLSIIAFLSIFFVLISGFIIRYYRTIIVLITGNSQYISMYNDATYEASSPINDFVKRLFWFSPDFQYSLIDHPLNLLHGGGSKYFGGTIGLPKGYSHNQFLDIFHAQGILGLLLFAFLLFTLISNSYSSKLNIFNFSIKYEGFTIILLYILLCTHNSGIIFHPLTIFPLIFIQDFYKSKFTKIQ